MHIRIWIFLFFFLLPFSLSGCSSIGKGIAEGILEQEVEDTRQCTVLGRTFEGVHASLERQQDPQFPRRTKILMVHGIGQQLPGYSTRIKEGLARELKLSKVEGDIRTIKLESPEFVESDGTPQELGSLRVTRHLSDDRQYEMIFYELTWSTITEPEVETLDFDNSGTHSFRRAAPNRLVKQFFNSHVPDLLVYMGDYQDKISESVGQAACWITTHEWEDLPDDVSMFCDVDRDNEAQEIADDDIFFITHSLGSQLVIDRLRIYAKGAANAPSGTFKDAVEILKEKDITVFMLANQLPLLQVGRPNPEVTNMIDQYCTPGAAHYDGRFLKNLNIVAFSDPNDILSYPVPPAYADHYVDSRLCPDVINVNINVAHVKSLLGVTEFANPLTAHGGYHSDERVIKIIAYGLQKGELDPMIEERCEWFEIVNGEEPRASTHLQKK